MLYNGAFSVHHPAWGPFLEAPDREKFSHPESHSKISNLMISELFYSHIINMAEWRLPSYKKFQADTLLRF